MREYTSEYCTNVPLADKTVNIVIIVGENTLFHVRNELQVQSAAKINEKVSAEIKCIVRLY